jgi:hypothetical protein
MPGSVHGIEEVKARLKQAVAATARGWEKSAPKGGEDLKERSQPLAPSKTGELRESAFVETSGSGFDAVTTVGYSADYAADVHEDLEARHENGEAKFLETPAREGAARTLGIVADGIKREVGL